MQPLTVLSLEQALALPYATLRMVHQGWRVIRIEATPRPDAPDTPGDPNRYAGRDLGDPGRFSYFIHSNVGKEAIALNLKHAEGRELLTTLIRELAVDIFCCNVLPARYASLGIEAESLREANQRLIWVGLSAFGPEAPTRPGYDNALQAELGFMDLTGRPDGPPETVGVPLVDLKSGDEVFTQVLLALLERQETGIGARIDVRMAQAASAWLLTKVALADLGHDPTSVTRRGNRHPIFVPTDTYACTDGHVCLAIGSDRQWRQLTEQPGFGSLARPAWQRMAGRIAEADGVIAAVAGLTRSMPVSDVLAQAQAAGVPAAPVNSVETVKHAPFFTASRLTTTRPDGTAVRLAPPAHETATFAPSAAAPPASPPPGERTLPYAPAYGADTDAVLTEAGLSAERIAALKANGVIA